MYRTYATPLSLDIKRSRQLLLFYLLVNLLGSAAIVMVDVSWLLKICMLAMLIMLSFRSCRFHNQPKQLIWKQDNNWNLTIAGREFIMALEKSSYVSPGLGVLCFRCSDGKRLSVLLLRDAIDAEQYRRLRVRIKVAGQKLFIPDANGN